MTIIYVLLAIMLFGVLIGVHEFGHFITAKLCGVKVEEFSIGMGPAVLKRQKGETLYSLRLVPIGGYCAMLGEDEASDDPRSFTSQKPWERALILVAGSFMNFCLGFLMVLLVYSHASGFYAPVIDSFMEGCPYEGPGAFQLGDRIWSIDGKRVYQNVDIREFLAGEEIHDIVVKREGRKVKLEDMKLVPLEYEGQTQKMYGFQFGIEEATPKTRLMYAWNATMEFGRWVWMGLEQFAGGQVSVNDMAGPVGIVDLMAETGAQAPTTADALWDILYLGAFIAVNLAIMNMLPIPALDGGRVFFLIIAWLIESIIGKKLDPKYEGYVHAAGMMLLLALMAYIMFNDIIRIVMR